MDHQNGEPPGQNAIAGGSHVVARARPGAILAREPRGRDNPMKRSLHGLIADGVVGGILAGLVVALWFLAVDSLAGRPFHTPAALASALTRQEIGPPTFRLVTAYSVLHFGVFAVLGVVVAGAMAALRTPPRLLFGVLFGLVAQEVAFYAGLFLSDASRVARSEEHTSELQSRLHLVCRLLLEKKKKHNYDGYISTTLIRWLTN